MLNAASSWVAARAPSVDKPAIVLDIDETSLANWDQIVHNKFGYVPSGSCDLKAQSACGQREWELSAQASAIRPTLELFNMAQKLKGKNGEPVDIFFVTGRFDDHFERLATEWNLHKVGYDNWRLLFMRPESSRVDKFVSRYKTASRIKIEATTQSSPMSEISRATLSAIRMAITPSDASRCRIRSTLFRAIRRRAASSNVWRTSD